MEASSSLPHNGGTDGENVDPAGVPKLTKQQRKRRNQKKKKQAPAPGATSTTGTDGEVPGLTSTDTISTNGDDSMVDSNGDKISKSRARKLRRQRAKQRSTSQGEADLGTVWGEAKEAPDSSEKSAPATTKAEASKTIAPVQAIKEELTMAEPTQLDPVKHEKPQKESKKKETSQASDIYKGSATQPIESLSTQAVKAEQPAAPVVEPTPAKVETPSTKQVNNEQPSAPSVLVPETPDVSSSKEVVVERSGLPVVESSPELSPVNEVPAEIINNKKSEQSSRTPEVVVEVVKEPIKSVDRASPAIATSRSAGAYAVDDKQMEKDDCNCAACNIM